MKFAHLADTHLGYRQYGLIEREKDFYEVFEKVIDKIIEENVDFVIHSGDLFETARPSPMALLTFQKGLLKLKGAGIPMYAIAGNHDVVMRSGSIPPQVIFKKLGLKVISTINPTYLHEDIFIAGLPYFPASHSKVFKAKLAELSQKASHHDKSILVLHQGIHKYFDYQYELEIADIPDNFSYYAMGHIHKYVNESFGKGKLVYPGSAEIWKTSELEDYKINGKGFVIVDMDGPKPSVRRVKVDVTREFMDEKIEYSRLESEIARIKDTIRNFDKKPILNLTIENVDGDSGEIYDIIQTELGELSLMIRPTFNMLEDTLSNGKIAGDSIGPKELIAEKLEGYGNSYVTSLAIDLYDSLSKGKMEESGDIIDSYFEQHYVNDNSDAKFETEEVEREIDFEDEDSTQLTFKGGLE